jgi:hypothetical protein
MSKISPTDKLFDELIPDSPEYWQAIENIDFEPKQIVNNSKSFVSLFKEIPDYLLSLGLLLGISLFSERNIFDSSAENDTVFTPIRSSYFADHLKELYPDVCFSVMRDGITIISKDGVRCEIARNYESWEIETEQEYKDLLAKVKYAVDVIRKEQFKLNMLKEARRNRIRSYR